MPLSNTGKGKGKGAYKPKKPTEVKSYVSLDSACRIIKSGGVVAIPTETVYGLAGSVFMEPALKQIFHIKKRPFFNPLIVHGASAKDIQQFHNIKSPLLKKMIAHFSPGPLTFVLNKTKKVHPLITAGQAKVALRIPRHPLTLKLLQRTGALCAPSANLFGKLSPTRPEHVHFAFQGQVPILNGGECEGGLESTVIEPDFEKHILHILRPGLISQEELRRWLKKEGLKGWTVLARESSLSPGHLKQHYQPAVPLWIIECSIGKNPTPKEVETYLDKKLNQTGSGWAGSVGQAGSKKNNIVSKVRTHPKTQLKCYRYKALKLKKSPVLSARLLYHELHILSQNPSHIIYVIKKPEHQGEAWQAIWDRLHKASSYSMRSKRVAPRL